MPMAGSRSNVTGENKPSTSADPAELRKALEEAWRAYQREFDRLTPTWQFAIGPLKFQRHIGSTAITWTYTGFNIICLAAGIFAILSHGVWTSLGVALVVGALFSFGTFVSQWWVVEVGREDKIKNYFGSDKEYATLAGLRAECDELARQLRQAEPKPRTSGDP